MSLIVHRVLEQFLTQFPNNGYFRYHAPRFDTLLNLLEENFQDNWKVLDIGRTRFTDVVANFLEVPVDSLGFHKDSQTASGTHYHFDLNNSQNVDTWRKDLGPYDAVIFSEVIEHLYTSPRLDLTFLRSIVKRGGTLFLQTPNAAALHKRIALLRGRNPYQEIVDDRTNPGHFRESTMSEIARYAKSAGFQVEKAFYDNYFDYRFVKHTPESFEINRNMIARNFLYKMAPSTLKPGMTFVLKSI